MSNIKFQSRIVGFILVLTTLIGLFNTFLLKPMAYNPSVLLEREFQFRAAQMLDLTMFALVIWMSIAMYLSVKHINKNLARLVFAFRLTEGILGCVVVLITFMALLILKEGSLSSAFNNAQILALYEVFLSLSNVAWEIHFCFLAVGVFIYFYLQNISKGLPKWLIYWGFFTYLSVFLGFSLKLLFPNFPEQLMLIMAPGALFELTVGCWLLIRGMDVYENTGQSAKNLS